jgi:hypothetical protein
VELKQAQALKLKAEAQKVISEAGAPQQQGEPPESDIDIALKHEDIIFKRAQTEKVYAEIEKIKRGEDRADSQHSTDAHFKGRQQEMAEESAAHERAEGSKDPD